VRRILPLFPLVVLALGCSLRAGDPPADYQPNVLGTGLRLRDVQTPSKGLAGQNVLVTSAVVTAIDNFDETVNGKSRGTIYLQDVDVSGAYAGISLFSPSFIPANLRLSPGDVVDLNGQYVEQKTIGTTVNFDPAFLPQLVKPAVTFRYETKPPEPVVIPVTDLDNFDTGRKWVGVLVTVQNVTVAVGPVADKTGTRVTANFTINANSPSISNELYPLAVGAFPDDTTFKSVTGVVTFFFNLKIAPRSAADLVQ